MKRTPWNSSIYLFARTLLPALVLPLLLSCSPSSQSQQKSQLTTAKKGLSSSGSFQVSEEDSCPVCGMNILQHTRFAAAVELKDGRFFYTCGTGCAIRSWLRTDALLGVPRNTIKDVWVQEFFSGKVMNANDVTFIAGSDFIGPMGKSVAPVAKQSVDDYQTRHGGTMVFTWGDLDEKLWQEVKSKK